MSGGIQISLQGDELLAEKLRWLCAEGARELLDIVGAEAETQTKRRIQEEKTSAEGMPWAPWSEKYARTRRGSQSLLQAAGHLLESIDHEVDEGESVVVGSNLIYAAIHQFGGDAIGRPWMVARPYLGLSDENEQELSAVVEKFFERRLAS